MIKEKVRKALAELPSLTKVFGEVIEMRLDAFTLDSFLLEMLATRAQTLNWWEERTAQYLTIINNPQEAIDNLVNELQGDAKKSDSKNFDGRVRDAMAEICAVVELSSRGNTGFRRIPSPRSQGQKHPDFECLLRENTSEFEQCCVEVKNFRAPIGVLDYFNALYKEMAKSNPEILKRSITLSHYWDNTVTEDQEQAVKSCFEQLSTCHLPFETTLAIEDEGTPIKIRARVQEGNGVSLQRDIGGEMAWGPFTKREKFLLHAMCKICKGLEQLENCKGRKPLLVLNIETPDGIMKPDLFVKLREMITAKSAGKVKAAFMHEYCWIGDGRPC